MLVLFKSQNSKGRLLYSMDVTCRTGASSLCYSNLHFSKLRQSQGNITNIQEMGRFMICYSLKPLSLEPRVAVGSRQDRLQGLTALVIIHVLAGATYFLKSARKYADISSILYNMHCPIIIVCLFAPYHNIQMPTLRPTPAKVVCPPSLHLCITSKSRKC